MDNTFVISMDITNNGTVSGKEVVQIYVSAPFGSGLSKPLKELKAFGKTKELKPGEKQTLNMMVTKADLASKSGWVTDKGNYQFQIGTSSRDMKETLSAVIADVMEVGGKST